jgi:uncharacterized protein
MNAWPPLLLLQLQIPAPVGYVNDFAGVLDARTSQAMTQVIDEVREKSGGEIVVVTLRDFGGRPAIDVARDIGRQWRVGARGGAGDRGRNAGVVLLLKPGARPGDGQSELAISTGTGAEGFVTDALSGRIRDAIGQEAVATGSYGAGLALGVSVLAEAYAREFGFRLEGGVRVQPPADGGRRPRGRVPPWPLILLILIFVLAGRGGRGGGIMSALLWGSVLSGGRRGGGGGGWGGGGFGGGGFGGFGGGGGFSGGGTSGRF